MPKHDWERPKNLGFIEIVTSQDFLKNDLHLTDVSIVGCV